ncbi:sugar transferase [Acinetobacter indicus]|uniref:sugar transferase n=1 Tax=Acinetobacter indicus TaxID=756892 RepID=UPI001C08B6CF|nr:sugar transferase [Acinetobacter indicus]
MIYDLSIFKKTVKRSFDLIVSIVSLITFFWLIFIAWLIASIDTKSNGFFFQQRVGKGGEIFNVVKIKTMKPLVGITTTVTRSDDLRITRIGAFFRKTKIDELPQLFNVLVGQMSIVGPRPDVPGFADKLEGIERSILNLRPGITGPASIKYRNEEEMLSQVEDPERFNREVIWPDKVALKLSLLMSSSDLVI